MNQRCEPPPALLGCYRRRLDGDRRLRLPGTWTPRGGCTWLLFPRHLLPPCQQTSRELFLIPAGREVLREIVSTSRTNAGAPSIEAALALLRENAGRLSLAQGIATAIRIGPTSPRFTITAAQLNWLGCRGRTLILAGGLTSARILTPAKWAAWQREVERTIFMTSPLTSKTHD